VAFLEKSVDLGEFIVKVHDPTFSNCFLSDNSSTPIVGKPRTKPLNCRSFTSLARRHLAGTIEGDQSPSGRFINTSFI